MRHALVAVLMTVVLAFGAVFAVSAFTPEPVQAAPLIGCELVVGPQTRVVCTLAGEVLLNTVVDLPTVTLPPLPGVTVTAPGATVTLPPVTLPAPPRATQTIRVPVEVEVPGPTSTVTVNVPGSDTTITLPPEAGRTITETVRPNATPIPTETVTATETQTATTTEAATGQPQPESGTVDPSNTDDFLRFDLDLGDESVSAGEASVGLLGALLILLAIWAGMTYGFRRGRASSEAEESDFIREVLDENKTS